MALPIQVMPTPTGFVASYDYYDLFSSVGYKTFYPADTQAPAYFLATKTIYSDVGYTIGDCDLDFDVELKNACNIKGDVLVNVPCARLNDTGGSLTIGYTCTVYIRKYSGVTETDLGNAQAAESVSIGPGEWRYKMNCLKITVADTHFNAGDKLRVSAVFVETAGDGKNRLGHDPVGRTFTNWTYGTQFRVDIPFKLDN